jgi:hypothetical protein
MPAARPLPAHPPSARLLRWPAARGAATVLTARHAGWTDTRPPCLRSEAFAEDLPDLSYGRALPLDRLPAPERGTARTAPLALAVVAVMAALLGALVLGLGG